MPKQIELLVETLITALLFYFIIDFTRRGISGISRKKMNIYRWYSIFEGEEEEPSQRLISGINAMVVGFLYISIGVILTLTMLYFIKYIAIPL
jgi:hypothetical protein